MAALKIRSGLRSGQKSPLPQWRLRRIASQNECESLGGSKLPTNARKRQSGQAVVEYLLVTMVVIGALLFVIGRLRDSQFFFKNFTAPIVQYLKYNYKYADPLALGWDEDMGPRRHIQISIPNEDETFKMFIPQPEENAP